MMRAVTALSAIALTVTGCHAIGDIPTETVASARMMHANGIFAGQAQLLGSGDTLSLAIAVTGIAPGEHGFHLHTTGTCTRPDFKSAGGHLNPTDEGHGLDDGDGSHLGDLPNLVANNRGAATATVELRGTRAQVLEWLFDADGTAIVIHADPDDGTSEPSGNAGSRVACGVLTQS